MWIFTDGRREGFVDWLTAPNNPLFARVAVNRIWAWHFGEGLQRVTSDFGLLGGTPSNQKLLDYLASEFVAHNYDMKWLHRLIVTSDTYQLSSRADARRKLRRTSRSMRATPICGISVCNAWKRSRSGTRSITLPGDLDLAVGGKSFQLAQRINAKANLRRNPRMCEPNANRGEPRT